MNLTEPPQERPNERQSTDPPPDGACPRCGGARGHYNETGETVFCPACELPWPSSYWAEQV